VDAEHFFSKIMTSSGGNSTHRGPNAAAPVPAARVAPLPWRFSFPPPPTPIPLLLLLLLVVRARSASWSSLTTQEHWKITVKSTRSCRSSRLRKSSTSNDLRNAENVRNVAGPPLLLLLLLLPALGTAGLEEKCALTRRRRSVSSTRLSSAAMPASTANAQSTSRAAGAPQ
jgi:hypothetical protein